MDRQDNFSGTAPIDIHSRLADALGKVGRCVTSLRQYGRAHPCVQDAVGEAHHALSELLVVQPTITLAVTDSFIALDGFPIEDRYGGLTSFVKLMRERMVGELRLMAGLTTEELTEFADAMSMQPEDAMLRGGFSSELAKRNVVGISACAASLPTYIGEARDSADIYEDALNLLDEAMTSVRAGVQVRVPEIRFVVSDALRSIIKNDSALLALAGVKSYDRYLSEHSMNVCILSMVLGRELGLDPAATLELGISALLHDVGKVFVPVEVINKPGKLSEIEWNEIRRHPVEGARALAMLSDIPALAPTIALEHHVRRDGSGYPLLPPNHTPHLLSRLVAIVDAYDALTTGRPYRERWKPKKAVAWMLYEESAMYDRLLMARFAVRAGLYPVGCMVKLKGGDYAVVVAGSCQHPEKPSIRLVIGPSVSDLSPIITDLSTEPDPDLVIESVAQPVEVLLPYLDTIIDAA